ncbi:MAG: cation:proton antiporter [Candidatus Cloacimonetes bacterium]|nr:cation:proton antiporter [Candidatus Cloacimonadota bacterium]
MMIFHLAFYFVLAALAMAFVRFMKGPTSADRVVALDAMTISGISIIVFIALGAGRIIYLDVAIVYALLSFLGVIAVARYLEGGL